MGAFLAEKSLTGSEHVVRVTTLLCMREAIKLMVEVPPPLFLGHSGNGADDVTLAARRHRPVVVTAILVEHARYARIAGDRETYQIEQVGDRFRRAGQGEQRTGELRRGEGVQARETHA